MTHPLRPAFLTSKSGLRHRLLRLACIGVALSLPASVATGQDQAATQEQPATQQGDQQNLVRLAEDFYHSATVGSYAAAQAYGEQLLAGNFDPEAVLDAFVEVNSRRGGDVALDRRMMQWQQAEPIAAISAQVVGLINQGRMARATNPTFVAEQLERLSRGNIAYRNALAQLSNSGEYAVPVMIQYLRDPQKAEFHADIRRAMRELGVDMLNPLWASMQMEDEQVKASLLIVLGELGYDVSVPYLLEQLETSQNQAVRRAAEQALQRLGYTGGSNAADEFYNLAEKFFYEQTPVGPNRRLGTATIWSWGGQQIGLVRTDVPPQIFNEVMAMRASGKALGLGQGQDQALALWLASNYRREGELGPDEQDRTQPEGSPSAHFYGAQAGTSHLMNVLARAQQDRQRLAAGSRYNTADLSLRAIKSLQEIIGRGNIQQGESPLTAAMNYPDRQVRIEAAFALAQALPTQGFAGQEQVVPLLADALSQTGQPTVLVLTSQQETLNSLVEQLRGQNYQSAGTTSVVDAVTQAQALPSVDVLLIDSTLGDEQVNELLQVARSNPKLSGAAKLVLVSSEASRYEELKLTDPTLATTTSREGQGLLQAVESARTGVGGLPLDAGGATELAVRSGNLLKLIGTSNSVFDLESGEQFLMAALEDQRPQVRMLAGEVVALLDTQQAQPVLLEAALADGNEPEVRISLLNSLATSAKIFGNRLGGEQVNTLLAAAANRENLDVQAAAAEAVGAANLPADQARRLIIEQTQGAEVAGGESQTAAGTVPSGSR